MQYYEYEIKTSGEDMKFIIWYFIGVIVLGVIAGIL